MKNTIYYLIALLILGASFFSCEKEETRNPAPPEIQGSWKTIASKDMTTGNYAHFETVKITIPADDNGSYFYEDHKSGTDQWNRMNEGTVNWKKKGDVYFLELYEEDYKAWNIEIVSMHDNYFIGNVEWNGNQEQFTFVKDIGYTIYGIVLYDNQPVEDAVVTLRVSDEEKLTDTTCACGLYWLTGLNATGMMGFTLRKSGYYDRDVNAEVHDWRASIADAVTMRVGESTLSKGIITGYVYDKNTLQPLHSVRVGYGDDYHEYTYSGGDGDFTLTVPEGNWNIYAGGDAYVNAYEKIEAKAGEDYTIIFYLNKAVTISGNIISGNIAVSYRRIGDAKVVLYNDEGDIVGSMFSWTSSHNYSYLFEDIPAGEYTVSVEKEGYSFAVNEKNVNAQETVTDLNFEGEELDH